MISADRVAVIHADITTLAVDAIGNAANTSLLGGGGVDGAIHLTAGPGLLAECRSLRGCPTGEAKITGGYRLKAKWVIHTPGPIWHGGGNGEKDLLASCYHNVMRLASEYDAHTVALPSISTGVYGFPIELAAGIAAREVRGYLARHQEITKVYHVCFSEEDRAVYQRAVDETYG